MPRSLRKGWWRGRADLIVPDAEDMAEALRTVPPRRWVVRGARVISETAIERRLVRQP